MHDADRKTSSAAGNTETDWDRYINEPAPAAPEPKKAGPASTEPSNRNSSIREPERVDPSSEEIIDPLFLKLEEVQNQLQKLGADFQSKLKYDAHKNRLIDDLHQELQAHKDDVVKRFLRSMMMDLIQFIDSVRKLTEFYAAQDPNRADPEKLIGLLKNIPSDLEDICGRQGVTPFSCEGSVFDPTRQRALKQVYTTDSSRDKEVADRLRPGYEWEDQIIRPEMVAVYTYRGPAEPHESPSKTATPEIEDETPKTNGTLIETDAREERDA